MPVSPATDLRLVACFSETSIWFKTATESEFGEDFEPSLEHSRKRLRTVEDDSADPGVCVCGLHNLVSPDRIAAYRDRAYLSRIQDDIHRAVETAYLAVTGRKELPASKDDALQCNIFGITLTDGPAAPLAMITHPKLGHLVTAMACESQSLASMFTRALAMEADVRDRIITFAGPADSIDMRELAPASKFPPRAAVVATEPHQFQMATSHFWMAANFAVQCEVLRKKGEGHMAWPWLHSLNRMTSLLQASFGATLCMFPQQPELWLALWNSTTCTRTMD